MGASASAPWKLLQPSDNLVGALVGMKYRMEHLDDHAVIDNEDHPSQQREASNREYGKVDSPRKYEVGVRNERKRQMQSLDSFPLIVGVLGRKAEEVGDAKSSELGKMVAERAGLWRTAACPGDRIPTIRRLYSWAPCSRVDIDDGAAFERR
jgi:hypothetical protein